MALSSLAAYGDSDSEQSDQEETCAQKKIYTQTKELMTVRRTKETSKRAGTVQITVPKISKRGDSSDEDDEGNSKDTATKRKPIIKSGTGLSSLLPKPKRFQGGTKRTNSLIPPSIKKSKQTTPTSDNTDDYSNIQFFSNLDNTDHPPLLLEPTSPAITIAFPTTSLSSIAGHSNTLSTNNTLLTNSTLHNRSLHSHTDIHNPQNPQYPSLQTNSFNNIQNPQYPATTTDSQYQYSSIPISNTDSTTSNTIDYNSSSMTQQAADDDRLKVDEASLYRLAGGSSKRGKRRGLEEQSLMNIKDISENEIKDAVAYQKYLTEDHPHTSGTVPEDLAFSSTQKRKHQIHWLAAQAKAKEQELKNFWSQAAATRKQTQMKYGF